MDDHRTSRKWGLAVLCAAQFVSMLDITVVNLALPSIRRDLGTGVAGLQWIVGAYVLAFACLLLSGGSLGDRLGRRRVFLWGLAVFTCGSLLCAAAPTLEALVAGRVCQGVGAALFVPATLAFLTHLYPEPGERARAMGVWSGVSALALPLGPVIGGALVDSLGWASVFWVNGPFGAATVVLARRVLPEIPALRRGVDVPGQVLATGWLGCLTYGLIEAERSGWSSPQITASLGLAGVLLAAFLAVEHRSAQPMVPLALFRDRRFAACNGILFAVAFGLLGSFLFLSLFVQQVQEYTPSEAGLRMLPLLLPAAVAAPVAGRLAARYDPALPMVCGMVSTGAGLLVLATVDAATPYALWWPALVPVGAGVGLTMAPTNAALMSGVAPARAGIASATSMTSQQVGNVLGVAVVGAVVAAGFSASLTERADRLGLSPSAERELVREAVDGSLGAHGAAGGEREREREEAVDAALTAGIHRGLALSGGMYLAGAAAAAVFVPARRRPPAAPPAGRRDEGPRKRGRGAVRR
ncbi:MULTISPECIES: MFS transporter [unclassified Streptomyces]|uniref:MFS transporter n=1 Tax=unclassified Streptomyces TaxID=2593676 RepID=UPI0022B62C72|nr:MULTISPECIES: MFS transporter [unclassified Streptomyces]MCZ7415692.1 MFS transporter [Streptomyces sp. WMMC897]MCZ7434497.1 MFS transporter [Streptomyces sp. WMMC1477]